MNTGIEILLKRMKDCPEDFYYNPSMGESRWARLVDNAIAGEIATQEERELLEAGMKEVRRQKFTESVMQMLAGVDETSDEGKSHTSSIGMGGATQAGYTLTTNPQGQATWATTTATGTISADSIMLGNTKLNEATINQILQAHKEVRQKQTKPKHWWNKSIPELLGKK